MTDDRHPGWRARVVHDEYAGEPDGDALAPALVTAARTTPYLAKGVYVPHAANMILAAWHSLGRDLFQRYLRMFHGVTAIAVAFNRDTDVWCFDTADFRRHVGITTTPADLASERAEWQAWLDGEVYGVIVERRRAGTTTWDDGTTAAVEQWLEVESVWGMYGHAYAREEAADLLHTCAA
ncbi:hypothetical protein ACQEVZ_55560 [Dactylosporangium sp. CA-152071]|uniref:hypothetical protein n=1 Tax=Dactylosporangium sp. CA-152071 TaxID=3239933 RepID=UPI003D8E9667